MAVFSRPSLSALACLMLVPLLAACQTRSPYHDYSMQSSTAAETIDVVFDPPLSNPQDMAVIREALLGVETDPSGVVFQPVDRLTAKTPDITRAGVLPQRKPAQVAEPTQLASTTHLLAAIDANWPLLLAPRSTAPEKPVQPAVLQDDVIAGGYLRRVYTAASGKTCTVLENAAEGDSLISCRAAGDDWVVRPSLMKPDAIFGALR